MKRAVYILLLGLSLCFWAGCDRSSVASLSDEGQILYPPGGAGLVADGDSPLPDVPVPVGFVLLKSRSSSTLDGNGRHVDHTYQGLGSMADTVAFYRQQLAAHGWSAVADTAEDTSAKLTYRNMREKVEVYLSKPSRIVTVHIFIGRAPNPIP